MSHVETCGKIQSAKWVGKFVSSGSGEIIKVNEELEDEPKLINTNPYDKDWGVIIKPTNLDEELKKFDIVTRLLSG